MTDEQELKQEAAKQIDSKPQQAPQPDPDILEQAQTRLKQLDDTLKGIAERELKLKEYEAKKSLGGQSVAGQQIEKDPKQVAEEEAKLLLKRFRG